MATEYSNLHYISFHLGDKKAREFGSARLAGYLMDMWMSKKLVLPGIEYSTIPPGLSAEELAAIPHAEIAMGQFDRLTLSSCVRGTEKIDIKLDAVREWTSSDDEHREKFLKLQEAHNSTYRDALSQLLKGKSSATAMPMRDTEVTRKPMPPKV